MLLYYAVTGVAAWLLTALWRRYALRRQLLDHPNDRSSHQQATPRGGGIAFVLPFIVGTLLWLAHYGDADFVKGVAYALLGAGGLVALVGFIDDHRPLSAAWRLLLHLVAALWAIAWLGGLPPLVIFTLAVNLGWVGDLLAVAGLVWMLNLFNFMDGIDGIASVEALSVLLAGGVLIGYLCGATPLLLLLLLLAAALGGFLLWNWPPAKIFMGDVGSGFLGVVLGIIAVAAAHLDARLFWVFAILLGVFIVDTTYTLVRRQQQRQPLHLAHCSHAFQQAARRYQSHRRVTLAVGGINLLWLLPWAALVALNYLDGAVAAVIAYTPLVLTARYFRAGEVRGDA
ncbi:MAG: glycosyltransferase family 4 protein [Gammaproteobacteria bacterium]|nr:glycosyltransferase family 4 protein [Gammaproteobacteria bacterium]